MSSAWSERAARKSCCEELPHVSTSGSNHVSWGYIRVSGDEQADRGLPVAGQRRALEEYAREHNHILQRVFVDEARSGGSDQREQ